MGQGRTTRATVAALPLGLDEVKRTLRHLIQANAGIPGAEIHDASSVDDDLAMDSMSFLALQVAVEERFGINCTPDEIVAAHSFAALATLVRDRAARAGTGSVTLLSRARRTARGKTATRRARENAKTRRQVRR